MRRHRLRIITLLALLVVTSACDDSAQEAPPPPDPGLSVNLINTQPKVVTVVVKSVAPQGGPIIKDESESKIFSGTIVNDQIPAALKTQTADPPPPEATPDEKGTTAKLSLNVPPPSKEGEKTQPDLGNPETSPAPAKTIDATGAYRVDAAFGFQRVLPKGYPLEGITPQQEHIISGGGLTSMNASRYTLLALGKKLTEGTAVLRNRKGSLGKTKYEDGVLLFYEQPKAKDAGSWKLRTLAGEETVLDLGGIDVAAATIAQTEAGVFLLKIGAIVVGGANKAGGQPIDPGMEPQTFGYVLVKSSDKSVTTICATGCTDAHLVLHPTDGVYVQYQDTAADNQPLMLVSADGQKKFTLAISPTLGDGESWASANPIYYSGYRFLPSGEFVYTRALTKIVATANAAGTNSIKTTTHHLFNLADSSQRVVFETTDPTTESLVDAPSVQRTLTEIIAVSGDRVLARMADNLWSFKQPTKPVTDHLTWIAADGTKTDIVSTEVTLRVLKYWPETNRVALQIDEAAPAIKIVKADSGKEETVLKKAVGQFRATGAEFWPFLIFDNREGLSDDEHKFEIIGPYLDRVELGAVEGGNISIRLTDLATDAAPTRVADETVVPQLTLEVPPEVSGEPGGQQIKFMISGATPFDKIAGDIACEKGMPFPNEFSGTSDFVQEVEVMLLKDNPVDATCTITATDGFKTATSTVVVKYVKKEEPPVAAVTIEQHPVKWTALGQMWAVIPGWNNQFVRASMEQVAVKAPWVVVKGSAEKPTFICQGLPAMLTNYISTEVNCEVADAVCWSAGIQWKKTGFPTDGKTYKCTFQVGGAMLNITMTNTVK